MRLKRGAVLPAWVTAGVLVASLRPWGMLQAEADEDVGYQPEYDHQQPHYDRGDYGSTASGLGSEAVLYYGSHQHAPGYSELNYYTDRQGLATVAALGNALLVGVVAGSALAVGQAFLYSGALSNSQSISTNSGDAATNTNTISTACTGMTALSNVNTITAVTAATVAEMTTIRTAINNLISAASNGAC